MNWLFKIDSSEMRKELDNNETTVKLIDLISDIVNSVKLNCENFLQREKDLREELAYKLDELKDDLDFTKELLDGTISKEKWDNYSFDGDFWGRINNALEELYDICDTPLSSVCRLCFLSF